MKAKENLLRAIYFEGPEYVPRTNENVCLSFQFEGNFRSETWTDKWGVQWVTTRSDMVPFPKGNPLPSLEHLDDYVFPEPDSLQFTDENESFLNQVDRDKHLVFGTLTYFLFERAWALMGMDNFLKSFFTHPKEMKQLLHRIADFNIGIFERYLELGIDGVNFSEDLGHQGGLMISPRFFRDFFVPEHRRCFEPLVKERKIVDFHSCGRVQDIVEDLISVGVTVLNPVQARANDLVLMKQKCMGKMALKGGIDSHLLMLGPVAKIEEEVERVMAVLSPGGGYIVGPDQSMPFPPENIESLWRKTLTYGKYPVGTSRN
jgi:uroporphyrinogen decarboxylase